MWCPMGLSECAPFLGPIPMSTSRMIGYVFVFLLVWLSCEYGIAQAPNILAENQHEIKENTFVNRPSETKFNVRSELVLVPVTVTDAMEDW